MDRLRAAAAGLDGLEEIGAFEDADAGRIVAIWVWGSPAAMQAGMGELFASVGELPLDRWETRPFESATLTQVA